MIELQTVDVKGTIENDDMPCCPFCDNKIEEYEPIVIVICEGSIALAHGECANDKGLFEK